MSNVMEMYDQMCDITAKAKRLEEVSGHDIDTLISLFVAGWILTPSPQTNAYLEEIARIADQFSREYIIPADEVRKIIGFDKED